MLVVPAALVALAGVGLQRGTGSTDLVRTLAEQRGLRLGNLLVAVAIVAPAFSTVYSGSLAVRSLGGRAGRVAPLLIAVPGLVLAVLRFDRRLLGWLALLAAVLPPLIVPMAVEGGRRRRGESPRRVPPWTWVPASGLALALTAAGMEAAPLAGLAVAAALTLAWTRPRGSRPSAPASRSR